MGFHNGAYAKVWEVSTLSPTATKAKISISVKNKTTGEYDKDFSSAVLFVGTAVAASALKLQRGQIIKLGSCDVSNRYDKEKNIMYTNYKVFNFDLVERDVQENSAPAQEKTSPPSPDDGEPDDIDSNSNLPF